MRSCPITSPVSRQRHRRHHSPLIMALQISIEKLKWGMQMLAVWADKSRGAGSRSSSFSFLWSLWKSAKDYSEWRERVSPKPLHISFLCHQTFLGFCRRFHAWQFPTQTVLELKVAVQENTRYALDFSTFSLFSLLSLQPTRHATLAAIKTCFGTWTFHVSALLNRLLCTSKNIYST